jgi:hypothetical protein
MDTYIDIFIHIFVSIFVGIFVWNIYGNKKKSNLYLSLFLSQVAGLLIDVDHFIDYFFYFGFSFDYDKFISGQSFIQSGKNYVFFHGWEYVFLFAVWAWYVKKKQAKMILTVTALSLFFHLCIDSFLFGVPVMNYFIFYRILNNFSAMR